MAKIDDTLEGVARTVTKQLLEQSDKVESASEVTLKKTSPAKLTPEDEAFLRRKAELVGGTAVISHSLVDYR